MALSSLKDAQVKLTRVMPSAASTTVTSGAIDTQNGTNGNFVADVEFLLSAPALTTVMLPDTRTMTYNIIHSVNSDLSSSATLVSGAIVQTGASSAGASAATYRWIPPKNVRRYIGITVVSGASTTDASTLSATFEGLF